MEGKHTASHPHHLEHQQSKGTETNHSNDPNDTRVCSRCGWAYPNAHPSAKHRRKHKKHCGKIEGFKLINPTTKELKCGSSDDDLSEDEHMSTVNKKMGGEHITDHQHQHEHLLQPAGSKTNNTKDHRDVYHCHWCGWPYPNHYPGPKHRRNHRKHCGKIEGYPLITSEDRETQGGSSDDEHKSNEHVEMEGKHISSYQHEHEHEQKQPEPADYDNLDSYKDNSAIPQTDSSSRKLENTFNNLDVSSSEANVEKAGQKTDTSANATLDSNQIIVQDVKVSNLNSFNVSAKEVSEAATGITIGLGLNGLIASETTELPKDSTHQDASGPVEHQEFTDKGLRDYAELKIQNKIDDRVLPKLGESISSVVQPHPSSDDVGGGCDLQIMNEAVKDDTRVTKSQPHIPKDVKISFAKVQEPGKIELAKSATTTHAPIHHKGIVSRKIGIASILSFKEINSDDLNSNSSSVKKGSAAAAKIIYEVAQINHQVSDGKTQDVSISEMKGQEMQHDVQSTSDCSKGSSTISSSGADSQKENPQSWTSEPQSEKMPQSSDISIDSSATNLDSERTGAVACHQEANQEANSTVTQGISDKPEIYTESKNSSPLNADSGSCRGREEPQNFSNVNSNRMLALETDKTLIVSGLVNQDKLKETEVPCSKGIEKISDGENHLQASSKEVIVSVQAMSNADECLPESSKEAKQQDIESSACVVSSLIDHENNGFDPDHKKEDSTEQKSTHSGMDIFKHEVESSACKVSSIIDPDKNGFDLDCKKEDTTEKTSTMSDMDIFKHDDASEIAQQNLNKRHASEVVVDEKPAAPKFHLSECVDYSHEGNTVEQDISVKLEDHVESTSISPLICGDTDNSRVGEKPASFQHKICDGMLHLEEGKEKLIEDALLEQGPMEDACFKAIETTSCENQDAQDSSMVIADPGISCTSYPQTGKLNAGESEEVQCCASSSSIIEHGMNDGSLDCKIQDSTQCNITLLERDVHDDTKIIPVETVPKISINEAVNENSAASEIHQREAMVHTVEEKSTEEQITNIIPVETVPKINTKEAMNESSATSESHQQEAIAHPDEEKGTQKQVISVKLRDYIESKLISPSNGVIESHRDESSPNSNVGMTENVLQPEVHKSLTTESELSKNTFLDEAKVPYSKGTERDIVQKVGLQTSRELVILDHRMSVTASSPVKDSQSGQMLSAECSGFAKMTTNECDLRDGNPGCNSNISVEGNTALPDIDMDGDIYSNIRLQEIFSKAPANDLDQEYPSLESVQPKTRDTNSSLQDYDHKDLKAEIHREKSDCEGNKMGPEHSVLKQITQLRADKVFVDESCSATKASSYLNDGTDNLENSCRESTDDVHEDKSELLKNCEPALWEQLLETNANKSTNQETYQGLGNAGTSPGNPFIYGHKPSSKEDIPQTLAINGRHGLITELGNMSAEAESMTYTTNNSIEQEIVNSGNEGGGDMKAIHSKEKLSETSLMIPADLFEAPSFMTLVESGNQFERQLSHNEIQLKVKESNGGFSADAEMASGTHKRFHTPLSSLLAEENIRGTQEHSKPDPLHVFQPQTSSQNKIQVVQASTVEVSNQNGTSSQKGALQLKDINSSSKKLAEKIWNSPARLPNVKVEKQKVSKVRSAWSMCLCGCDTK